MHAGTTEPWLVARTTVVLVRLTSLAPRLLLSDLDHRLLLDELLPEPGAAAPTHRTRPYCGANPRWTPTPACR